MERHSKIANVGFIMTDWNPFPRLYHILGRGLLLTAHLFQGSSQHRGRLDILLRHILQYEQKNENDYHY